MPAGGKSLAADVRGGHLAEAIWGVIISAYNQGGRTRVDLPAENVARVLMSLAANVIAQVPDASQREMLLRGIPPQMDAIVNLVRSRPDFHLPSRPHLILPN